MWLSGIDLGVNFEAGETIHTENSYKYRVGDAEALVEGGLRSRGYVEG